MNAGIPHLTIIEQNLYYDKITEIAQFSMTLCEALNKGVTMMEQVERPLQGARQKRVLATVTKIFKNKNHLQVYLATIPTFREVRLVQLSFACS